MFCPECLCTKVGGLHTKSEVGTVKRFAGTAGAPPAMSAKRENEFMTARSKTCAPAARCGRGRPRSQQIA